jgi:hypothetical protein
VRAAGIMSGSEELASPGTEPTPARSVAHLSKRFGARVAFDNVTFEVGRGDVFGSSARTAPGRRCGRSAPSSRLLQERRRSQVSPSGSKMAWRSADGSRSCPSRRARDEAGRLRHRRVGRAAIGCSLAPMVDDFVVVP